VVNLNRDPRWGRNSEGGAEDPKLAGAFGAAWARGLQNGPDGALQAVVTLKHFDAQTVEDSDGYIRFNVSANLSNYMLQDSYWPAFAEPIKAGAKGVTILYFHSFIFHSF
jgi:beta-glucosidase-like glycosyl hydrolase